MPPPPLMDKSLSSVDVYMAYKLIKRYVLWEEKINKRNLEEGGYSCPLPPPPPLGPLMDEFLSLVDVDIAYKLIQDMFFGKNK